MEQVAEAALDVKALTLAFTIVQEIREKFPTAQRTDRVTVGFSAVHDLQRLSSLRISMVLKARILAWLVLLGKICIVMLASDKEYKDPQWRSILCIG